MGSADERVGSAELGVGGGGIRAAVSDGPRTEKGEMVCLQIAVPVGPWGPG